MRLAIEAIGVPSPPRFIPFKSAIALSVNPESITAVGTLLRNWLKRGATNNSLPITAFDTKSRITSIFPAFPTKMKKKTITLKEWLYDWYESYAKPNIKRSTAVSYECYIRKHIVPEIGEYKMSEINLDILQRFFNEKQKEIAPKTIYNLRMMMHSAFKSAYLNDLVKKNYIEFVVIPTVIKKEMRVLTRQEQQKLLSKIYYTDEPYAFGVFLCLVTGIRIGELCALQWSDIDTSNSMLKITKTLQRLPKISPNQGENRTEIVIGLPKSSASIRSIPIDKMIAEKLLNHKHNMEKQYGKAITKNNEYIITHSLHNPVEPSTIRKYFTQIIDEIGIEKANLHSLRHTFATRALEAGIDFKTLSVLLGHSDISVTLNRYVHVLENTKRSAIEEIHNTMMYS